MLGFADTLAAMGTSASAVLAAIACSAWPMTSAQIRAVASHRWTRLRGGVGDSMNGSLIFELSAQERLREARGVGIGKIHPHRHAEVRDGRDGNALDLVVRARRRQLRRQEVARADAR